MSDLELDLWAEDVTRLLEIEKQRTEQVMSNMQQAYVEAFPNTNTVNPRDLINRASMLGQ